VNAFIEASKIEALAIGEILPWLQKSCERIEEVGDRLYLQKLFGDFFGRTRRGFEFTLELKVEESDRYGNFFFEVFSNKRWRTTGWFPQLQSDWLLYYFYAEKRMYVINVKELHRWAYYDASKLKHGSAGRLSDFPEKAQAKYDQLNDTSGICVPIRTIREEVGFQEFVKTENGFQRVAATPTRSVGAQ
jgi:hypothetical protein